MEARSIQFFKDQVAAERVFVLDEQHVERLLRQHFEEYVAKGVAKKAELTKWDGMRWRYIVNLGPGFYSGNQMDFTEQLNVVPKPAHHRKDEPEAVIFDRNTEARIRFHEDFGWVRLGLIHAGCAGSLKEYYEIGKEFDGFWALISVSC